MLPPPSGKSKRPRCNEMRERERERMDIRLSRPSGHVSCCAHLAQACINANCVGSQASGTYSTDRASFFACPRGLDFAVGGFFAPALRLRKQPIRRSRRSCHGLCEKKPSQCPTGPTGQVLCSCTLSSVAWFRLWAVIAKDHQYPAQ